MPQRTCDTWPSQLSADTRFLAENTTSPKCALNAALVEHGRDDSDVREVGAAGQLRMIGGQHIAWAQPLSCTSALWTPVGRLHSKQSATIIMSRKQTRSGLGSDANIEAGF